MSGRKELRKNNEANRKVVREALQVAAGTTDAKNTDAEPTDNKTGTAAEKVEYKAVTHNCDYHIDDAANYHNFTHLMVDQLDKSRSLAAIYKKFSPEEKKAILAGLRRAEIRYTTLVNSYVYFLSFFDHQEKQPVDHYDNAYSSMQLASIRLVNIANARLFMQQWDLDATYNWSDAEKVINETRFLRASVKN
jgi:hypothetical protein